MVNPFGIGRFSEPRSSLRLFCRANIRCIAATTEGPGFATESGIILDVLLSTTPVVWVVTPATVENNTQKLLYVTVDNIGSAVETGQSVGLTYAQLSQ